MRRDIMLKSLHAILFVIVAFYLKAQCNFEIHGVIRDSENKLPISYVSIQLKDASQVTSSDSVGNFYFTTLCSGKYNLHFGRIGFKSSDVEIDLTENKSIEIFLEFDPSVFQTVEILEEKTLLKKTDVGEEIIISKLNASQASSFGDPLKTVTGVQLLNTGNNVQKPVIHGLYGNRVLIYNNEVRHESQQWGNDHAPEIDAFIAEKIIVIKGAGSLKYGHDAMGGVILTEPADFQNLTGISGDIKSIAATNGRSGILTGKIDLIPEKFSSLKLRIQGTLKAAGNLHTSDYFLKNTGAREHNFSTTAEYAVSKFNVQIYYSQFNTEIGIFSGSHIGNLADLQRAFNSSTPLDSSGFSYRISRPYQLIAHEFLKLKTILYTGTKSQLNFIYARQYNLRNEYDKFLPRSDSIAALNKPELHLEITTHTGDVCFERNHTSTWNTQIGVNMTRQANTYEGRFFIPNFKQQGVGLFVIENIKLHKTNVEVGARYDIRKLNVFMYENNQLQKPKYSFGDMSASFGIHRQLNKSWAIIINGAKGWRPPQASELFSNGLHHGAAAVEIGDRHLTSEKTYQLQSKITFERKKFSFSVAPYFNSMKNFIYLTPVQPASLTIRGAFPTFEYHQINAVIKGIDIETKFYASERIQVIASAALLRAQDIKTRNYITQMPSDRYQMKVEQKIKAGKNIDNSKISATGIFVNKQWRVPGIIDYLATPDGYFLLSFAISAQHSLDSGVMTYAIAITNALNKQYRDYMNRLRYFSDEMGRNFTLQISYAFNQK